MNNNTLKQALGVSTGMSSDDLKQFIHNLVDKTPDSIPARRKAVNKIIKAMYDQVLEKNGPFHEAVNQDIKQLKKRIHKKLDEMEERELVSAAFVRVLLAARLDEGSPDWFDPALLVYKGKLVTSAVEKHIWDGLEVMMFLEEDVREWVAENFVSLDVPDFYPSAVGSFLALKHMAKSLLDELLEKEEQETL